MERTNRKVKVKLRALMKRKARRQPKPVKVRTLMTRKEELTKEGRTPSRGDRDGNDDSLLDLGIT